MQNAFPGNTQVEPFHAAERSADEDNLGFVFGSIRRRRWLVLAYAALAVTGAVVYITHAAPVYEAAASIRIEDEEANVPDLVKRLSTESKVSTEIEMLRSAALAREVIKAEGLQVRVLEPRGVARSTALQNVELGESLASGEIDLTRQPDGSFVAVDAASSARVAGIRPGSKAHISGLGFVLAPAMASEKQIRLRLYSADDAMKAFRKSVKIDRVAHDANIVAVRYRDADRNLAALVPNELVRSFIAGRQTAHQASARNTIAFLREQLDTVSRQLTSAESRLLAFRNRENVVSLPTEATGQVNRFISMQADRTRLETERAALAQLLDEATRSPAANNPSQGSPYRRLMAFPGLIGNASVSELLRSAAQLEDQRTQLLTRRTTRDPDVQILDNRIHDLDAQLQGIAVTYLEGTTNKVQSLDSALKSDNQAMASIPAREIKFARLERTPKVLQDISTLLQTRLQEASIAEAAGDPSFQIVDLATAPMKASWPKPALSIAAAALIGLLFGIIVALIREHGDRFVHSRADLVRSTGIPVLGLVPNLGGPRSAALKLGANIRGRSPGHLLLSLDNAKPAVSSWVQSGARPARAGSEECYARLYLMVSRLLNTHGSSALVITSPLPGDGKTTTAINLALTLSRQGRNVLLIDADLRRGAIGSLLGAPHALGLTDVLQATTELGDVVRSIEVAPGRPLHYIPLGSPSTQPVSLLSSRAMGDLLGHLRGEFDVLIIDSPPINVVTDTVALATFADGVIVVARAGVTERAALNYAIGQLRAVDAPVLGGLLNDIDPERDAVYDGAYQYLDHARYYGTTVA